MIARNEAGEIMFAAARRRSNHVSSKITREKQGQSAGLSRTLGRLREQHWPVAGVAVVLALFVPPSLLMARDLSFEERVKAQEAIERVYYSHQIGTSRSFAEAVPRDLVRS
jgi:sirohydrochlorin ferrochelatase